MATFDTNDVNTTIILEILRREGGLTNNPRDAGGRTDKGISERAHPDVWRDNQVTLEEATDIYRRKYLEGPRIAEIVDPRLRAQMADIAVNSGPGVAIQKLQGLVGAKVDGVLGPKTLALVNTHPEPIRLNNLLALERVKMIGRIVQKNPSQSVFLVGWINRALEHIIG